MSAAYSNGDHKRELLSKAIVETIKSWPEVDRQVFICAHYAGECPDKISRSLGLNLAEVSRILGRRERELRAALRDFRNGSYKCKGEVHSLPATALRELPR